MPAPMEPFLNLWQLPHGRFANELFHYFFAKQLCKRHGLVLKTPAWAGQSIFGLSDPPLDCFAPVLHDHDPRPEVSPLWQSLDPAHPMRVANVCIYGNFQYHTGLYSEEQKAEFRRMFTPLDSVVDPLSRGLNKSLNGGTLVAIHLRRGDYGHIPDAYAYRTSTDSYKAWLSELWPTVDNPVLYVASDEPDAYREFLEFSPFTFSILPFYTDFWVLSQAKHIAISNSSFSFAASMLNTNGTSFVRPLRDGTMIPFDPWNSDVLLGRYGE